MPIFIFARSMPMVRTNRAIHDFCTARTCWGCAIGAITAFGIEGTGPYGAGLSRNLLAQGHKVVEVTRRNRQLCYQHDKTDRLDAEVAARSVLARQSIADPKCRAGQSR